MWELCWNCVGKEVDEGLGREKKKCTHPEGYVLEIGCERDALFELTLTLWTVQACLFHLLVDADSLVKFGFSSV